MSRPERNNRLVLGIDPGSLSCGYGIVEAAGNGPRYITSGKIVLSPKKPLPSRLKELYEDLLDIIKEHRPSEAAVEKIFFAKSAKAALSLGQARGVALLASSGGGLAVHEYNPTEVKRAVTGYGRAEKAQIQQMVKTILGLKETPGPDSADALALALCHINRLRTEAM